MKKAIIALASTVILAACHANFDKAKSGLVYKIFPGKGGAKLATAKFVKLDIEYTVKHRGKDSVLSSTFGKTPQYNPIDTGARYAYSYMEILPKCSVGDSVEFTMSADTLRKRGINLPLEIFPKGDFIKGRLKILAAFADRNAIMADITKEQDKQKQKEAKTIEDYIARKHLNAQKTKSGAYVIIDQPGEGPKADSGKVADVLYKGYFLTGEVFETNMDTTGKTAGRPYPVVVGTHAVIQGWDEALPYFAKGGKGTVIVPSALGYGAQPNGPIPGGSTLIFDIQIPNVKDAPQQQQQPSPNRR
ncbi:MAG TPA: FKBP-type peptidyl-prolyl cis-trans isomerase [Chitinophagaceae bacterium]|nr:FKBP-type peptidyl-prolyl cis-trans isomerase [Chitinophagaceae bacterium]